MKIEGVQRHYFRVGSHLNLQTVEKETFQSSPELSGTYKRRFEVKPTSGMTRGDFSEDYWHSGVQVLFVTVFQTAVNPFCNNSLKTGSLLRYLDGILSSHTVGCCNIILASCLKQEGKNFAFQERTLYLCCNIFRDCSCFDATFGQLFTLHSATP